MDWEQELSLVRPEGVATWEVFLQGDMISLNSNGESRKKECALLGKLKRTNGLPLMPKCVRYQRNNNTWRVSWTLTFNDFCVNHDIIEELKKKIETSDSMPFVMGMFEFDYPNDFLHHPECK